MPKQYDLRENQPTAKPVRKHTTSNDFTHINAIYLTEEKNVP